MRLANYIIENTESILRKWESFARSIWPGEVASQRRLRDHAGEMLIALAREMNESEESKAKDGSENNDSACEEAANIVSDLHAISRIESGFDLQDLVAEYRALRKNVISLWSNHSTGTGPKQLEDILTFNEVLDRLLAEAVLSYVRRIDQSREVFLGILGHDLRNPLQSLMVQASILAQSESLDPTARKIAAQMSASTHAMGCMIGDLLDFTGSQLGAKMSVQPASMDLTQLCKEVINELKAIHPESIIVFERSESLIGEWDHSRLRQMISNLVGNALQHGCKDSPVHLDIEDGPQEVIIAVRNQGLPIPAESASIIFEPMIRNAKPETNRQAGSIGLGLYIAREVANAHGGSISVRSTDEETVFKVKLPRSFSRK